MNHKKILPCLMLATVLFACILLQSPKAQATSESNLSFELNSYDDTYTVLDCDEFASGELIIPATYNNLPVTSIRKWAFSDCNNLTSITLPRSINTIGDYAFNWCENLRNITIPDNAVLIGKDILRGCKNLETMTVPMHETLGYYFGQYELSSCTAIKQNGVTYYIPATLRTVNINGTEIKDYAFQNCAQLTEISIGDTITSIGNKAFYCCTNLENLTLGKGLVSIGEDAFYECIGLKTIVFLEKLTTIGRSAFCECSRLYTIVLPKGINLIDWRAFGNCVRFKKVYYRGTQNEWENVVIKDLNDYIENAEKEYDYTGSGIPCEHIWDNGSVTKEPSCKENGIRTFICTACRTSKTEAIEKPTTHSWDSGIITKQATHTEEGVKTFTCHICGVTKSEKISKLSAAPISPVPSSTASTQTSTKMPTVEVPIPANTTPTAAANSIETTPSAATTVDETLIPSVPNAESQPTITQPADIDTNTNTAAIIAIVAFLIIVIGFSCALIITKKSRKT